jgi:hypothetical protein
MLPKFEQFIRERQYLTNVSPATLEWYKHSFKCCCVCNRCNLVRFDAPVADEIKNTICVPLPVGCFDGV